MFSINVKQDLLNDATWSIGEKDDWTISKLKKDICADYRVNHLLYKLMKEEAIGDEGGRDDLDDKAKCSDIFLEGDTVVLVEIE